jgi:hypothetical protein
LAGGLRDIAIIGRHSARSGASVRGHDAVFGQVIDDQIDELDLVGAQRLA